jgi:hypothetical protein
MARLLDAPRLDGSMRARPGVRLGLGALLGRRPLDWGHGIAAKVGRSIAGLRFGIEAAMA